MADSILRLRVQSEEYDNKLKRASEAIQRYAEGCRKAGGTLTQLDDGVLEFTKALGQMETVSNSARGKIGEMTKAFTELSVQYNKLTEEEKQSPFGKALSESLNTLKGRIQEGKTELDDINKSLNGGGGLKDALDQVAGKFGLNIDMVTKFGGVVGVTTTALKVAKDAFFQSESNIDEWGRTVKGAEGAYDIFLQTLNNGNWSNFFSNLSQAITGARDLYDAFDRLNSIKANNAVAIATTQAEIQQLRLLKQQGQDVDDKIKEATQRLSALQSQSASAGINAGRSQVTNTLRNGVNSIGGAYINDATLNRVADNISKQGQAYFDYMKRRAASLEKQGMVTKTQTINDSQGGTYERKYKVFDINALSTEQQKQYAIAKVVTERETEIQKGLTVWSQAVNEQASNAREQFRDNRYALQGSGGGGGKGGGYNKQQLTEYQENQKKINELTQKYTDIWGAAVKDGKQLTDTERRALEAETEEIQKQIQELEKRNGLLNYYAAKAKGLYQPQQGDFDKNVGKFEMNPFAADDKAIQMTGSLHLQLDEESMKAVQTQIGKSLAKDGLTASEAWAKASRSISSVSSALSSVENPATKIMGTIGQAIATIALAYAETLARDKSKSNVWQFIATAAAAMISMATTISSIHSSTGYASGGIVDGRAGGFVGGTAYSGDNVGNVRLSSGELVLNRSQQNNLANALEGGMKQIRIVGQLKGEDIVLMADRYGRRSGLGELAFWK